MALNAHAIPAQPTESQNLTEAQRWWRVYDDPLMDTLADQLLAQNIDIQIAAARIEEARALSKSSRSAFFPDISATGSATRQNKDHFSNATILQGVAMRSACTPQFINASHQVIDSWEQDDFAAQMPIIPYSERF